MSNNVNIQTNVAVIRSDRAGLAAAVAATEKRMSVVVLDKIFKILVKGDL